MRGFSPTLPPPCVVPPSRPPAPLPQRRRRRRRRQRRRAHSLDSVGEVQVPHGEPRHVRAVHDLLPRTACSRVAGRTKRAAAAAATMTCMVSDTHHRTVVSGRVVCGLRVEAARAPQDKQPGSSHGHVIATSSLHACINHNAHSWLFAIRAVREGGRRRTHLEWGTQAPRSNAPR